MPRPMNPNTRAATEASMAARRRAKHEKWAAEMRANGWVVLSPEAVEEDTCGRNVCLLAELRNAKGIEVDREPWPAAPDRWYCCTRARGLAVAMSGPRQARRAAAGSGRGGMETVDEAIIGALRNWALRYPIPAWGLAQGEQAERLADNWARVAAGMVAEALSQVGAGEKDVASLADLIDQEAAKNVDVTPANGTVQIWAERPEEVVRGWREAADFVRSYRPTA